MLDFTQSEAFLGETADVKARGNTTTSVVQTDRDDAGNAVFSSIRGLSVSATARHEANPIAVGAGASLLLGLAGSFLFTVLAGSAGRGDPARRQVQPVRRRAIRARTSIRPCPCSRTT